MVKTIHSIHSSSTRPWKIIFVIFMLGIFNFSLVDAFNFENPSQPPALKPIDFHQGSEGERIDTWIDPMIDTNQNRTSPPLVESLTPTIVATLPPFETRRPEAAPTHAPTFVANSSLTVDQYTALYDLYYETNGPYWDWNGTVTNFGEFTRFDPLSFPDSVPWDFSTYDLSKPCVDRWDGVTCECADPSPNDGKIYCNVTVLSLTARNITGTLPESLINLKNLQILDFLDNHLTSTIPKFIANFPHLTVLSLAYNDFVGPIPSELSNLANLTILHLFRNHLTGNIPEPLFDLVNLTSLELSDNQLEGNLSPNISKLVNLRSLVLKQNKFANEIPEELGLLEKLWVVDLAMNRFTGSLPLCFTQIPTLLELYLHANFFSGTIPEEYGYFPRLISLFFGNNRLYGTLPQSFYQLHHLRNFDCQYNSFEGNLSVIFLHRPHLISAIVKKNYFTGPVLPTNGTSLSYRLLATYSAYENYLTGTVPTQLANSSFLNFLDLGANHLHGSIPNWMSDLHHLTYFYLNDNMMTGTIPIDFGIKIIFLVEMYLDHNKLTGRIPFSIGLLHLLVELNLHDNLFTGPIPNLLESSLRLRTLVLRENKLTGTLPNLGRFHNRSVLQNIDVSDNALTGTIPEDIYRLKGLETLILSGNCFHGSISESICNSQSLVNIAMEGISTADACQKKLFPHIPYFTSFSSNTPLKGHIPICMFNMPSLVSLYLSGNGFEGSLPKNLVIGPNLTELALAYNILTGPIPMTMQERVWNSLDLSNNKFSGTISDGFSSWSNPNYSLSLDINRLSGTIPSQLWSAPNVNMLDGNIFKCDIAEHNLPQHDPNKPKYSCGSDAIDRSIYVWLLTWFVLGFCSLLIAYKFSQYRLRDTTATKGSEKKVDPVDVSQTSEVSSNITSVEDKRTFWEHIRRSRQYFNQITFELSQIGGKDQLEKDAKDIVIYRFNKLLGIVRYLFLVITLFILCILMPIYGALSVWESTYDYTYSWSISAILLSGKASGAMLCLGFTVTTGIVIHLFEKRVHGFQKEILKNQEKERRNKNSRGSQGDSAEASTWEWLTKKRFRSSNEEMESKPSSSQRESHNSDGNHAPKLSEVSISGGEVSMSSPNESLIESVSIAETESISLESSPSSHSRLQHGRPTEDSTTSRNSSVQSKPTNERTIVRLATNILGFVNFVLMIIIDIVYVYVAIEASAKQVLFVQFLLSIFKIAWNEVALWRMYPSLKVSIMKTFGVNIHVSSLSTSAAAPAVGTASETSALGPRTVSIDSESGNNLGDTSSIASWNILPSFRSTNAQHTTYSNSDSLASTFQFSIEEINFLVYTVILNNVIIPCIAIAVVSSHCFYNAFFEKPPTETSTIYGCNYILTVGASTVCLGQQVYEEQVTYNTPFTYRYECSAAFSIKFTAVYIFMFIIVGLIIPLIHVVTRVLYYRYRHQYLQGNLNNRFFRFIYLICKSILPNRLKRLAPYPPKIKNFKLLANDRSIARYSSYLAILLSFGVLFPPLAVITLVSIYTVTYFEQFCIARILSDAKKMGYKWYKSQVAKECENIPESWYDSLWLILPFACFTYACVIFDTLGDKFGWRTAAGPSIFVFALPILFYSWQVLSKWLRRRRSGTEKVEQNSEYDEEQDIFQKLFSACWNKFSQWIRSFYHGDKKIDMGDHGPTEIELLNARITMNDVMNEHRETQYFTHADKINSAVSNPMSSGNVHS